jgi:hypothetical protein
MKSTVEKLHWNCRYRLYFHDQMDMLGVVYCWPNDKVFARIIILSKYWRNMPLT